MEGFGIMILHQRFKMKLTCLILIAFLILSACATPKHSYQDFVPETSLQSGAEQSFRVLAAIEEWRDSGVDVIAGEKYRVTAKGKWRSYGTCNWTDADGLDLYNMLCFPSPVFPVVVNGWSHSALIAKIGSEGIPFGVGTEKQWIAQSSGRLLFRINDTLDANWDNEGYVDVRLKQLHVPTHSAAETVVSVKEQPITINSEKTDVYIQPENSSQQNRFALIIGNSDYSFSPLKNPVNDAQDMADLLESLGFKVQLEQNANQQRMEEAIDEFGRKLTANSVALFYFAGHGVQVNGENYLIPVNAVIKRQSDVRYKAVNTGQVLNALGDSDNSLNIVILDACRNNPLPRSFRSSSRGLARLEGPRGTIFGFATSPGSVAADGESDNGIYTQYLLKHIATPGLSIEQVFKKVLKDVDSATEGKQIPWTESSFTGEFSFQ